MKPSHFFFALLICVTIASSQQGLQSRNFSHMTFSEYKYIDADFSQIVCTNDTSYLIDYYYEKPVIINRFEDNATTAHNNIQLVLTFIKYAVIIPTVITLQIMIVFIAYVCVIITYRLLTRPPSNPRGYVRHGREPTICDKIFIRCLTYLSCCSAKAWI